jgi:hypothetical protein
MLVSAAACNGDDNNGSSFVAPPGSTTTGTPQPDAAPPDHVQPPPPPPPPGTDAPPAPDVGSDAPPVRALNCPSAPCGANQVCCALGADGGGLALSCMTSCPNNQFPVACDGRDQCRAQQKLYCCALLDLGQGTPGNCPYTDGYSSCQDTCTTSFAQSCLSHTSVKPCHAASDCANDQSAETNCCVFGPGPLLTFCVSDALKPDGGTCL